MTRLTPGYKYLTLLSEVSENTLCLIQECTLKTFFIIHNILKFFEKNLSTALLETLLKRHSQIEKYLQKSITEIIEELLSIHEDLQLCNISVTFSRKKRFDDINFQALLVYHLITRKYELPQRYYTTIGITYLLYCQFLLLEAVSCHALDI